MRSGIHGGVFGGFGAQGFFQLRSLAWIFTGFLAASAVVGLLWAPHDEGKSLKQLEHERG
jgi:hypothetical protein